MQALNKDNDPNYASIPFDVNRSGFVMGEGAASLILEEYEQAKQRGAKIYAEMVGYGATCDAYHVTGPDPLALGAKSCMEMAVADAQLSKTDIDYINAHGTSTPLNDKTETLAIKKAFGDYAYQINVSSTKSMTGHLLGASGAIEAIFTALSTKDDVIPPTIGTKELDPMCDLNYTLGSAVNKEVNVALSNSLGFGGHNATIVFKKYRGE
jgi:3-oxoacyl-[acyl-carrier-protein] synthase II